MDKNDYCNYEVCPPHPLTDHFQGVSYRDAGKTDEWDKLMEAGAGENKENEKRKREYKKMKEASVSPLPKKKRRTKEETWAAWGYNSQNLPEPLGETADDEENQVGTLPSII